MIFSKIYFYYLTFFSLIYLIKSQNQIPQKFFGAFQYGYSDNWEDYLTAKGYLFFFVFLYGGIGV